jgi:hypothetical protein
MATTAKFFGNALLNQYSPTATSRIDWVNDPIMIALSNGATPSTANQDAWVFRSSAGAEVSSSGYIAGGKPLGDTVISAGVPVAITSSTGASPIVLTVPTGHGVNVADTVFVSNHVTNVTANGQFTVSAVSGTTITLSGSTFTAAGGATGSVQKIASAIASSTNATPIVVTTAGTHGLSNGDVVTIQNHATNTAANITGTVSGVTATTFNLLTYAGANTTGTGIGGATGTVIKKGIAYDSTTNESRLHAGAVTWTNVTFSPTYAFVYKAVGTNFAAATDILIGYIDFGGTQSVVGANFTIQFDSTGVFKITAA